MGTSKLDVRIRITLENQYKDRPPVKILSIEVVEVLLKSGTAITNTKKRANSPIHKR